MNNGLPGMDAWEPVKNRQWSSDGSSVSKPKHLSTEMPWAGLIRSQPPYEVYIRLQGNATKLLGSVQGQVGRGFEQPDW